MNQTIQNLNPWLLAGAAASAIAAILHIGCIIFGASWYRFLGAGEDMVQMVEAGRILPHAITVIIALVLFVWAAYASAAAGKQLPLPAIRWVVLVITAIYLLRAIAGFLIDAPQSGRSQVFWWWSSSICLAIAALHGFGLREVWQRL